MRYKQQQIYKINIFIWFFSILIVAGCATDKASLPSFEGKPRIKINQHHSASYPANPSPNSDVDMKIPSTNLQESL